MSDGPVYCPKDGTELRYQGWDRPMGFNPYICPKCGLEWNARFPVQDCRAPRARPAAELAKEKP